MKSLLLVAVVFTVFTFSVVSCGVASFTPTVTSSHVKTANIIEELGL